MSVTVIAGVKLGLKMAGLIKSIRKTKRPGPRSSDMLLSQDGRPMYMYKGDRSRKQQPKYTPAVYKVENKVIM